MNPTPPVDPAQPGPVPGHPFPGGRLLPGDPTPPVVPVNPAAAGVPVVDRPELDEPELVDVQLSPSGVRDEQGRELAPRVLLPSEIPADDDEQEGLAPIDGEEPVEPVALAPVDPAELSRVQLARSLGFASLADAFDASASEPFAGDDAETAAQLQQLQQLTPEQLAELEQLRNDGVSS